MMKVFEGLTVWDIILIILASWLLLTLFFCLQKVKRDSESAYLAFGSGLVTFGGIFGCLAYCIGSLYFLCWGFGCGVVLTLLFIRTASMREFRRLFLQNFAGTFWGCWLPSRYRRSRRAYHYFPRGDEPETIFPNYTTRQEEELERFHKGMEIWGTQGEDGQERNAQGLPVDSYGDPDWDILEKKNDNYDEMEKSGDDT